MAKMTSRFRSTSKRPNDLRAWTRTCPPLDRRVAPLTIGSYCETAGSFLYRVDFNSKLDINAQPASSRYQLSNQVRIKKRQHMGVALHDGHLRSRSRGRKLKSDISATNKQNSFRKLVQLKELIAGCKVFGLQNKSTPFASFCLHAAYLCV